MKYYNLKLSSDPKVIGVNNGITQVEIKENLYPDKIMYLNIQDFFSGVDYWQKGKTIPDFPIHIHAQVLTRAKLTDFLQFSPYLITCPFLMSQRVLNVFNQFKVQNYFTYPVTIYSKDYTVLSKSYYLFCCPYLDYSVFDFEQSSFYTGSHLRGKKPLYFKNVSDYVDYLKTVSPFVKASKLKLSAAFDTTLDYFSARIGGYFISEGLKDAIEILGFTGTEISEAFDPEIVL